MREFVVKDWKTLGPLGAFAGRPAEKGEEPSASSRRPRCVAVEKTAKDAARPAKPPAQAPRDLPQPEAPRRKPTSRKKATGRKRGERVYVVGYDGHFVGVFEAEAELTPREAFERVAQELAGGNPKFQAAKLGLYKPVLLRSARPSKSYNLVRGKLEVFNSGR